VKDEHREANRANWNDRARVHATSKFYDVEGFVRGDRQVWLHPTEAGELGDVRGKSLCHLQCHLGIETLSWARLGAARVVGLDFSRDALAVARTIAERSGLSDRATFVEADVHDAVRVLEGHAPFDVVYVSVGAICWLPSIRRWADIVASLLAPGGVLYVREVHPMLNAVYEKEGVLLVDQPYFERVEPTRWDDGLTYTEGRPKMEHATSYEWSHGLGEIVQALLDAGLSIELLREQKDAEFQPLPSMIETSPGLWQLPPETRDRLPMTFSLRARRT
jgi:SAM-dependent methyltransferase